MDYMSSRRRASHERKRQRMLLCMVRRCDALWMDCWVLVSYCRLYCRHMPIVTSSSAFSILKLPSTSPAPSIGATTAYSECIRACLKTVKIGCEIWIKSRKSHAPRSKATPMSAVVARYVCFAQIFAHFHGFLIKEVWYLPFLYQ